MARPKVRLHNVNVGKLLQQRFVNSVNDLAYALGAEAGDEAFVEEYSTDRSAAAVIVPTEAQARDGVLTRAAAALGLEVRAKP
ncbi:Uncharacterised protein [Nocardia otitidiscaviarum]|uniref:Uncharacterized protein n=1 Tax=Nocardia otitidiscaviarum TaxID=1823 RepID=A0A378Y7Z2_9NOCA|nr:hypothetical protein [Nocardia otitidiscaviarum]SUA72660.1 Uncharacterised protein [Nocardia otitidiscaviarum]